MKMGRNELSELEPLERRVALMHVAGASRVTIAQMLCMNEESVQNVLFRKRVSRFVMLLHGVVSNGLEEGIRDMNEAFKHAAQRAFELEQAEMESLHELGKDPEVKVSSRIRAKIGVTFTARDILDRAGHRAPTKVFNYNQGEIPAEAVDALTDAARELVEIRKAEKAIDVTPNGDGTDDSNT